MTTKSALILLIIAVGFVSSRVDAQEELAIKQEIKAMYMQADAATRARDVPRLMRHYADDFKLHAGLKKVLGVKEVADLMHWQVVATKEIRQLSFEILTFKTKGDTAVATVRQKETLLVVMNGESHVLVGDQTSEDHWVKTVKGWRLRLQDVKKSKSTRDGKVLPAV